MTDNAVWFDDCIKTIEALRKVRPFVSTFSKIEGNMYGDFVIYCGDITFIVTHDDFSVYCLNKETGRYESISITYPNYSNCWED